MSSVHAGDAFTCTKLADSFAARLLLALTAYLGLVGFWMHASALGR